MNPTSDQDPADPRLVRALEEYLAALEGGQTPDRCDFARRYPDLAEDLAECLDGLELMHAASPSSADDPTPQPSSLVGVPLGDYRILREAGRGGMGVVYEAEQLSLRRRVALKVLPFAATLDAKQLQRFRNEAQAAAHLHHPNIVPVYAVGCERGVHYYAMQFIDGQTVAALIAHLRRHAGVSAGGETDETNSEDTGPPAPELVAPAAPTDSTQPAAVFSTQRPAQGPGFFRTAAAFGVQAASALEHAHQTGVIHRDVKPANLLLDARGNLWVTDFGLAQVHGQAGLTLTGDLLGTLRYMSPEQALAHHGLVDHRSDVYALGATLYELLTLRPAVPGVTREEVLRHLLLDEPRPLRRVNPAVPVELETVVLKAMAKSPEERYATAQELADDLQRFLDDRPIQARPPSVAQRARRWLRRHRPLAAAVILTAAGLLVAGLLLTITYALQQSQLAAGLADVDQKRQDTNKRLFQALLDHAEALRHVREPGYRGKVWADLREAAALEFPGKDLEALRPEVLGCLGDPLGLEPVESPAVVRAARPAPPAHLRDFLLDPAVRGNGFVSAVSADGQYFAMHGGSGRVAVWKTGDKTPSLADVCRFCGCSPPTPDQALPRKGNSFPFRPATTDPVPAQPPAQGASPVGSIYDLTFTADGRHLVAGCEAGVVVWNVPTMVMHWASRGGTVYSVAAQPSGPLIATAGRQLELWSLNRRLAAFKSPAGGHAKVEFTADGNCLLVLTPNRVPSVWSVRGTPEKKYLDAHGGGVPGVAFSPSGQLLASASKDRTVKLWHAASGTLRSVCRGHQAFIEAIAFSPDGRLLASGDFDGMIHLWDAVSGEGLKVHTVWTTQSGERKVAETRAELVATMVPGQIWRIQFDPEGRYLAAGGDGGVKAWKIERDGDGITAEQLFTLSLDKVIDLAIHPGGEEMAILDRSGTIWAYRPARDTGWNTVPRLPRQARASAVVRSLVFDPTGQRLFFVAADGKLASWDWRGTGGKQSTTRPAYHLALSPDGRWLATASPARGVVIDDRHTGTELLALPPEEGDIWALSWSPDGTRVALGLSDGGLAIWNLEEVRARLAEFGITAPSTRAEPPPRQDQPAAKPLLPER
jgi:serine/threonine protein kinase/WD40 repeat protein